MKTINIAQEFNRFPAGRVKTDGPYSGERFRQEYLEPLMRDGVPFEVELDGVRGYGSSFLEEAFGGLVRLGYGQDQVKKTITLVTVDSALREEIHGYIDDALK